MLAFIGVCPWNHRPNNDRDGASMINEMSELRAPVKAGHFIFTRGHSAKRSLIISSAVAAQKPVPM
jgi:hypothetical protein